MLFEQIDVMLFELSKQCNLIVDLSKLAAQAGLVAS